MTRKRPYAGSQIAQGETQVQVSLLTAQGETQVQAGLQAAPGKPGGVTNTIQAARGGKQVKEGLQAVHLGTQVQEGLQAAQGKPGGVTNAIQAARGGKQVQAGLQAAQLETQVQAGLQAAQGKQGEVTNAIQAAQGKPAGITNAVQAAQGGTQVQANLQVARAAGITNATLSKAMGVPVVIQNATLLQGNPETQPALSQPTPSSHLAQMHSYAVTPIRITKTKTAQLQNSAPELEVCKAITQPVQDVDSTSECDDVETASVSSLDSVTPREENELMEDVGIVSAGRLDFVAARKENELMKKLKAVQESPPRSPEPLPTYDNNVRPVFFKVCD